MDKKIVTYNKISPIDDIKIEPFDINKRYTKPHRHNKYLELVYFQEGQGTHYLDGKSYPITTPIFFFIWKEQVHHWEIDTIPKGYVIIIKEEFLTQSFDKNLGTLLARLHDLQVTKVPNDPTIATLFKTLSHEIKQHSQFQKEILEGCLKALLAKILSYAEVTANPSVDMISKFIDLLEKKPKNNVRFYAEYFNTTAQNLNALCKKKLSKTASEVIASYMIQKTKRLLLFTDLSVAEIALFLEFNDTSHFIKYFKRQVGQTPLQFKKESVS